MIGTKHEKLNGMKKILQDTQKEKVIYKGRRNSLKLYFSSTTLEPKVQSHTGSKLLRK